MATKSLFVNVLNIEWVASAGKQKPQEIDAQKGKEILSIIHFNA